MVTGSSPRRVLVVGGNGRQLVWLASVLRAGGYDVEGFVHAQACLRRLREGAAADAIVVDSRMADMHPVQLAREVERLGLMFPIAVVTRARTSSSRRAVCLDVHPTALLVTLERLCGGD